MLQNMLYNKQDVAEHAVQQTEDVAEHAVQEQQQKNFMAADWAHRSGYNMKVILVKTIVTVMYTTDRHSPTTPCVHTTSVGLAVQSPACCRHGSQQEKTCSLIAVQLFGVCSTGQQYKCFIFHAPAQGNCLYNCANISFYVHMKTAVIECPYQCAS